MEVATGLVVDLHLVVRGTLGRERVVKSPQEIASGGHGEVDGLSQTDETSNFARWHLSAPLAAQHLQLLGRSLELGLSSFSDSKHTVVGVDLEAQVLQAPRRLPDAFVRVPAEFEA